MNRLLKGNVVVRTIAFPALAIRRAILARQEAVKRNVASNLASLLTEDPVLRLEEFESSYVVDRRSDLFSRIVTNRSYEPELANLCRKYVDSKKDVVDIGANVGFFSVFFASLTPGKILSVEPTPNAISYLKRNIEMNDASDRVIVYEGAASDQEGQIEIKSVLGKEEYSSLGVMSHPEITGSEWKLIRIETSTLDNLVKTNNLSPGFLKVDVEGMEHLVFGGASDTLRNHRPIIISELSNFLLKKNGSSARAVVEKIRSFGYDIYDPIDTYLKPGAKGFGDLIAFPKELNVVFPQGS